MGSEINISVSIDREKSDLFLRCIRELLNHTFIVSTKRGESELYRYVSSPAGSSDVSTALSLFGYTLMVDSSAKTAMLQRIDTKEDSWDVDVFARTRFSADELHLLLVLWNAYLENSDLTETPCITRTELISRININDFSVSKTSLDKALEQFKRFKLIDTNTRTYDEDEPIVLYPSLRFCMSEERLRQKYNELMESETAAESAEEVLRKEAIGNLCGQYENASPSCAAECREIQMKSKPPKSLSEVYELQMVLKAVRFLETNKEEVYIRTASETLFGDTKALERGVLDKAVVIIQKHDAPAASLGKRELLNRFHIIAYPQEIFMKGSFRLSINWTSVNAEGFSDGIRFSSRDADRIDKISICVDCFVTVENKTSFFQCGGENAVFFFLSGFATDSEIALIKKIHADNPDIKYLHFDDIDAGGFRIHDDLCRETGIPFEMTHMGIQELKKYRQYGKKLEGEDRKRLKDLPELYAKTAAYMIENDIKLEQEIVVFSLQQTAGDIQLNSRNKKLKELRQ